MRSCPLLITGLTLIVWRTQAKILTQCEAAEALIKGNISRTFISNFVCVMQNESGLDTRKITGPKAQSSFSYGVFQINSAKWCTRGRVGGICNQKCENFADDDIQDDVKCAKKIQEMEGFKHWEGWMKKCKNKPLPNISGCKRRKRSVGESAPGKVSCAN
ncbi:lysozyme c-1-like [Belonocnema kinseyi]|uniref:lysozyme c-1-like n=1 Tax=Belonocnema kinseyi TaxID=2817044 RepID=UPI00143D4FEE|nr:lysozyme c-1-like [Belonocnema kinseyi]